MRIIAGLVLLFCGLGMVMAHQRMVIPVPRTGVGETVNGICMSEPVSKTSGPVLGLQQGNYSWSGLQKVSKLYNSRPCGCSLASGMSKNVDWASCSGSTDPKFDMTRSGPYSSPTYTANSVITVTFKGFIHDGTSSLRLCYANCNLLANYEQYVLGYWFHEGIQGAGTGTNFSATLSVQVKLPNRNCVGCVLQWVADTQDVRSYVSCADINIVGAVSTGLSSTSYYCNGHPYCDCQIGATALSYGLHGRCPQRTSAAGVIAATSLTYWCKNCPTWGCPVNCGGPYRAINGKSSARTTITTGLPSYTLCSAASPCLCNQCGTGGGATKVRGTPQGASASTILPESSSTGEASSSSTGVVDEDAAGDMFGTGSDGEGAGVDVVVVASENSASSAASGGSLVVALAVVVTALLWT